MSAASGCPGSSPSGRLLTRTVTPWPASPATSWGAIWPLTNVRSSSWRIIGSAAPLGLGWNRRWCRSRHRRDRRGRQPIIFEIGLDLRIVSGPGPVHFGIVERVAARQDEVAEAL